MLTDERDVDTSCSQRATVCGPAQTVLVDPLIERILCFLSQTEIGRGDTLEDIVVVLRGTEDGR